MEGQRRQGGALWACCPARSRSPPTAATVGVVLSHGFTGTPQSLRPWAEHLAAAGLTVRSPGCPGTAPAGRTSTTPAGPTGTASVERAFDDLRRRCRQVFGMGLSMGGTLATRLAEQRPAEVAGLVLVNPSLRHRAQGRQIALPLLHRVVPSLAGIASDIKQARRDRARLRADAAAGDALAVAGSGRWSWPTSARSPRRCSSSAAGSTTSSSRCHGRLLRDGASTHRRHRGDARGQLPRGHARQRRAGDLRRQPGVHPRPHLRSGRGLT